MSFRRKDDAARCKQLDLTCSLSQLLSRRLTHVVDSIRNHRHNGERAYMAARVDQLIGSAKIGTPAGLCQRLSRVKKPWPHYFPLGQEPRNRMICTTRLPD